MAHEHILVVEDDEDILELITYNLRREGYTVTTAETGEDGLEKARVRPPQLVLLDLMLPKMDGLEVCRRLKEDEKTRAVPIIMVSAKGEESDVVSGLELGAEDYVSKPFRPRELVARVRAALRRGRVDEPGAAAERLDVDGMVIDPGRRTVSLGGKAVELTYTEFQVLHVLARRPGWVFTRYQIVDAVRGEDYPVTDRAVDVQMVGLRKKLGKYGKYIETVRGVGYRFRDSGGGAGAR
ncbi:MAG: response regulator transcription factor [Lentisphaerae bacterium]|nr:response regulator transcription factor [Lentisphaerota bacterium]